MQATNEALESSLKVIWGLSQSLGTLARNQSRRRPAARQAKMIISIRRQKVNSQEMMHRKIAAQQLAASTKANTKCNKAQARIAKNSLAKLPTTNSYRKVPHKSVT